MAKSIFSKAEADKIAVAYSPKRFPANISATAQGFVAFNTNRGTGTGSSFRIDRIVAEQTGVAELERVSMEEKVEREALVRLKEIQEDAFTQAYQLGLDEGREKAFEEHHAILGEKVEHLQGLLQSIEAMKLDLVAANETSIMNLIFYMAKRVVLQEISTKPEIVLEIVRQAVMAAQSDERVTIRVSNSDLEFIETVREKLGKEYDAVKRAKIEASDEIASGGCVVETNYGNVSSTIDQRLEKLWRSVSEKLPKVRNVEMTATGGFAAGEGEETPSADTPGESSGDPSDDPSGEPQES